MRLGVIFPQTEIGNDPGAIRAYIQGMEGIGYRHLLIYDHVLGASIANRPDWDGPYTSETPFHEVFVLLSYAAALTQTLELVTGVLILPQRQTALVAKQAATLDVLSGGRLRLGVGVGWNPVEYEALGEDFSVRGARLEQQIELLHALWTHPVVTFHGSWDMVDEAGLNPLPVQQPIPLWIGGEADAVLRRAARLADGWFPQSAPNDAARAQIKRLHGYLREAGRAPETFGIEPRLSLGRVPEAGWPEFIAGWRDLGMTHLSVNTMGMKFTRVDQHLAALEYAHRALSTL